ncbi:MAG: PqqD family protein [Tannerellaceae bacterium]|jgi:hypothetical protein|nr:PqqD family protein [Tannerellaceae bacterium]
MKKREQQNLFDLVPAIAPHIQTETVGDRCLIVFPRFRNKWMQKYLTPRHRSPLIRIRLDDNGSAVWRLIDGNRSVASIAEALTSNFSDSKDYALRIAVFINQLQRQGYIELKSVR